jgi:integrase
LVQFGCDSIDQIRPSWWMTKPRTGTIIDRGSGTWRLQVAANPDPLTGECRRLSRTIRGTRADARAALQRLVVEAGDGLHGDGTLTVGDLLEQFMASATLGATTRADWMSVTRRHLVAAFGELPLWKLTARDCDQLYGRMRAAGLGPSRVPCAHVVLHRAVAQAVRWGWLPRNPVFAATRPAVPRPMIVPPSVRTVRAALAAAETSDPSLWCYLLVALATGARRGEVCALLWCDVDLDNRFVRISQSVSQTTSEGVVVKCTKTDRARVVSLTRAATAALLQRRHDAERNSQQAGCTLAPASFVFSTDAAGQQPWPPAVATRRWKRLREETGLGRVRIRDLRHFVATQLLSAGVDPRAVSNRLGHGRTSTTFDIYWAWVPARDREAAEYLDDLLGPDGAGEKDQ